jgi:hypothetical protein
VRSTHAAHSLTGRSASDDTAAGVWCSGNNIILVPGIDTEPEAVNCILYYTDLKVCGGGTAFVPCLLRTVYAACILHTYCIYCIHTVWIRSRYSPGLYDVDDERHVNFLQQHSRYSLPRGPGEPGELYAQERLATGTAGTAFFYRQDTWHRGSCMVAGTVRRSHHLVWR